MLEALHTLRALGLPCPHLHSGNVLLSLPPNGHSPNGHSPNGHSPNGHWEAGCLRVSDTNASLTVIFTYYFPGWCQAHIFLFLAVSKNKTGESGPFSLGLRRGGTSPRRLACPGNLTCSLCLSPPTAACSPVEVGRHGGWDSVAKFNVVPN